VKKAFSLIELSIVILIIGIIIAGVTQSSALLQKAKIQSSQTLTKNSPVAGIEGLLVWFEPTLPESFLSSEAEEGHLITQWNDINPQTSNKLYMIQSPFIIVPNQFYKKIAGPGGLPSIYFDAGESELDLATSIGGDPVGINGGKNTAFIAYRTTASFELEYYSFSSWCLCFYDGDPYNFDSSVGDFSGGNAMPNNEIASLTADNVQSNLYINGSNVISEASVGDISSSPYLGIYGSNFYVSEIIIYDRVLKDEERHSVEQYLGKKYGINVVKTATPAP
jgi:prepilin-type N-terminal cleavage/methylation domain-containing protein